MRFRPVKKRGRFSRRGNGDDMLNTDNDKLIEDKEKKNELDFKINARNKYINDAKEGTHNKTKIVAYTSISPNHAHSNNQLSAVDSWHKLGLEIYSLNNKDEIIELKKHYPSWVNFVEARKTSKHIFGKPCVMINEMMDHFQQYNTGDICMLINSDIIISPPDDLINKIKSLSEICIPISHRADYRYEMKSVRKYEFGFDVFFIHKKYIDTFPQSIYSMGQTWWDYWIPYTAIKNNLNVFIIQEDFAFHKEHPLQYNEKDWVKMTEYFKWENNIDIHGSQETTNKIRSQIIKKSISYPL